MNPMRPAGAPAGRRRFAGAAILCAQAVIGAAFAAAPPSKPAAPRAAAPAPETVARVNGKPILRRDFDLAVELQFRARRPGSVGFEELKAARETILDRLIDGELLYQDAARSDVSVSPADVDADLAKVKGGLAAKDFESALKENGVTEAEFREQVRRTLLVQRFVEREVVGSIAVSDADLRLYYDQNPAEMKRPEAVRVSQILLRVPTDATPQARAAVRQRVEAVLERARGGADFADLARRYSEGPEAQRGGDAGFLARGGGPPALERAAFDLPAGAISDVVETRLGYHLIKVHERRPEGPVPFEEAKEALRARRLAAERDEKIRAHVAVLRETARIERQEKARP